MADSELDRYRDAVAVMTANLLLAEIREAEGEFMSAYSARNVALQTGILVNEQNLDEPLSTSQQALQTQARQLSLGQANNLGLTLH